MSEDISIATQHRLRRSPLRHHARPNPAAFNEPIDVNRSIRTSWRRSSFIVWSTRPVAVKAETLRAAFGRP